MQAVTPPLYTIGHGRRPVDELLECLHEAGVQTLVDVRRFPGSRRNPQFNQEALSRRLDDAGIAYRHAVELGGRRSGEAGEERFACLGAFAGYASRMGQAEWQQALADALAQPVPCFMCAETAWHRCHRRLISELLVARGHRVVHLIRPREHEPHQPYLDSEVRNGTLYLCGSPVA
ncbi:MAG TPA: DUF488 domain-containing protein [Gaiellaceae bacterium]|nr:DUF488 domain-containing protein [Gaiellaceae bacterium]